MLCEDLEGWGGERVRGRLRGKERMKDHTCVYLWLIDTAVEHNIIKYLSSNFKNFFKPANKQTLFNFFFFFFKVVTRPETSPPSEATGRYIILGPTPGLWIRICTVGRALADWMQHGSV